MRRNTTSIFIAFIAGLAIVGFFTMLIKNPGRLFTSILIMVGVAFLLFVVLRAVLNRAGPGGNNNGEMKKYRQAVKQSNEKYKPKQKKVNNKKQPTARKGASRRRKNVPYLKVIDGKKSSNSKNDQAN